jgi:hypothetical protein
MKSLHQINIENYHSMIETMHPGHNMHVMHRDWHASNPDPELPTGQNPNWGANLIFGTNFLQMHHEMVKATNSEPHQHMMHDSVAEWYKNEDLELPQTWDPSSIIPQDLNYEPDASIYPDEIRIPIEQYANSQGQTIEQFLTRATNNPKFQLPAYLSIQGVNDPSKADPLTGAMKLSDYVNSNQLGCSLVFPHNEWHGAIGGAMTTTWTAIADPIFYLGVHRHVDRIFDEFKLIEAERSIRALDFEVSTQKGLPSGVENREAREFTKEERKKVDNFFEATKAIRAPFSN